MAQMKVVPILAAIADMRNRAGLTTDDQLAEQIGVHPTQIGRVLAPNTRHLPGNRFIAGLLHCFGTQHFTDLFAVVPDNDED